MSEIVEVHISEYSDYFSNWWGLEDGTMLPVDDPRGYMWMKIGGKTMPDHETVQRILDARN